MAFPFGGHPPFSAYLTWAAQDEKCSVQTGYGPGKGGRPITMTKITAPNGRHVIVTGMDQDDRLEPSFVAYLDRRLDLTSPWHFPVIDPDFDPNP